MSNLSELVPSGGGQNLVEFVASGTLPNGKPVILNSDGTVSIVDDPLGVKIPTSSTPATWGPSYAGMPSISVDPNNSNKIVIAYADSNNSLKGTAVVGIITGTTVAFGTPVVFYSGGSMLYTSGVGFINTANKFIVSWGATGVMRAAVGTVTGDAISFGSASLVGSSYRIAHHGTVLSGTDKYVAVYRHNSSNDARAHILTASGTSISVAGYTAVSTGYPLSLNVSSNQDGTKCLFSYREVNSSSYGHCRVASVSGTSLTMGSIATWLSGTSAQNAGTFMDNGSVIITYKDSTNSNYCTIKVGTVSGTTITLGTAVVFATVAYTAEASVENYGTNFAILYKNGNMKLKTGTISGTTPTLSAEYDLGDFKSNNGQTKVVFRNNKDDMLLLGTQGPSYSPAYENAVWFGSFSTPVTNLTSANLIGITSEATSSGATAKINTWGGINEALTSLTIASDYYAQDDGTITTATAGQKLGTAISATTINMKDLT